MIKEIRIAGSGGQGIIMSGYLLGMAATIYDNKIATQTQSYGPEARGGASKTDVIISDDNIYYPYVQMADIFVSLSQPAYDKYRRDVKRDSLTFIDPIFVRPSRDGCISISATQEAISLGSKIVANIIMLSAVASITDVVKMPSLEKSIAQTIDKRFLDINIKAMQIGSEIGKTISEKM